jgi:predicted NACHT family NTPase
VIFKEKTGKEEEKTFDLVLACTDSNGSGISKGLLWVLESNGKRSKEAIKGTYQRRDEKDFIHFPIDENKVGEFSDFDLEIEDNAGNVIKEKLKVPAE